MEPTPPTTRWNALRRRAAVYAAALAFAAGGLTALATPAHADTATLTSANATISISPTSAPPGALVTITVAFTNPYTDPSTFLAELFSTGSGGPFAPGTCTTDQGSAPELCSANGLDSADPNHPHPIVSWGTFGGTRIPAQSAGAVTINTTVRADAQPGAYGFDPYGETYGDAHGYVPEYFSPDSATFTVTAPPTTDLGVALTATPVPRLLNGRIDYTLTITNNGPATATTGTVKAPLPAPMGATSPDCTVASGAVTCTVTNLAPAASVTRHFSAPVGLLSLGTTYKVTATRTASSPADTNAANDSASRSCTALTSLIINCS
ncbi:hypothetical protein [Streptomyces sp. NPDC050738]|uniref:hypothetical protein n=1 Tax=Streptomyces sp. NPDC050738 TaxID=3154744 RepID=UPI0034180F5F